MKKYLFIGEISRRESVPALLRLSSAGYRFVVTGDGDGLSGLLEEQGVAFEKTLPVWSEVDFSRSRAVGVTGLSPQLGIEPASGKTWPLIADELLSTARTGRVSRSTKETRVDVEVSLDGTGKISVKTGIEYFDHMIEQIAKHGGLDLKLSCTGDLGVDEHHTVEDTAIVLGQALKEAIGDKHGIARFGFWLPMDEAASKVTLDLSDRPYLVFKGSFPRERVGGLPTEMVPHFYRSLSLALGVTLHVEVEGENAHHMVESTFKAFGRALRLAISSTGRDELASTKGVL